MRTWVGAAIATLLSAAFLGLLRVDAFSDSTVTLISNSGQLLAAALGSAGCAVAAVRSKGPRRRAWQCLAAGTGSWAAGQAVWSFYEVGLGREVPFPSLADVGFLAFPLVAGAGLLIWSGAQGSQATARGRDLMDGAIIAVSLLVLSWLTVMEPVVETSGGASFSLALSLAYPLGDVVLVTLLLITLLRSESERVTLTMLVLGLGGFALADSLFVYMTTTGTYSSTDLVSSGGWVFGFLFVAASGMTANQSADAIEASDARTRIRATAFWLVLPYVPLVAAGVALCADLLQAESSVLADLVLSITLVVMMLARQFLAMIDNQRLLLALAEAGGQLEHQANHDALTGLPNRALFGKRLDRALLATSSSIDVLFCDLDNFKEVNDELGHAAGDVLLRTVADRLVACVRVGDTVARLGGDEFAILLEDCPDAREVADRIVSAMRTETDVLGHRVCTSISVGIARHEGDTAPATRPTHRRAAIDMTPDADRSPSAVQAGLAASDAVEERQATADLLLRLADTAMYAAKSAGKGRAAFLEEDPVLTRRMSTVPT
ncbi:diguanylate cyclase domain-containing protein [Nocardioides dilutus]